MKFRNDFSDLLNEAGVDPKVTRWIAVIFVTILLSIILITALRENSRGECQIYYNLIQDQFEGIIHRKYRAQRFNAPMLILDDGIHRIIEDMPPAYSEKDSLAYSLYEDIKKGQKIIKKTGELKYYLISKQDTFIYELKIKACEPYLKHTR